MRDQLSMPELLPFSADSLQDAAVRPHAGDETIQRGKNPLFPGKAQPLWNQTGTALIGIKS